MGMASGPNNKRKGNRSHTTSVKNTFKKARVTVNSVFGEEDQDFSIPGVIKTEFLNMAEGVEVLREMGQLFADTMSRMVQERDDANLDRFHDMLRDQGNIQRDTIDRLGEEFSQLRMSRENDRGRQNLTLTKYDGIDDIDDWQDRCEEAILGNGWTYRKFMDIVPSSLSGRAKRAFNSLREEDKTTKEAFYLAMKKKIDPLAPSRNKDLFVDAKRGNNEPVMTFIDRLRMYIRRSGGNPTEHWAQEIMKNKVFSCLSATDRKILKATVSRDEDIDIIILKADEMLGAHVDIIGAVNEEEEKHPSYENNEYENRARGGRQNRNQRGPNTVFRGNCWECHQPGHTARNCPEREAWYRYNQGNQVNQCIPPLMGNNRFNSPPPNYGQSQRGGGNPNSHRQPQQNMTNNSNNVRPMFQMGSGQLNEGTRDRTTGPNNTMPNRDKTGGRTSETRQNGATPQVPLN